MGDEILAARLLIVDDEPANVRLLERLLGQAGYTDLHGTTDSRRAVALYRDLQPDLLLLDLLMPNPDGLTVLRELRRWLPEDTYAPVLILTADVSPETRRRALGDGATDFLLKPFDATEVLLRIRNLLQTRVLHRALQRQNEALEAQVRERTAQLVQSEKMATMGQLLAGVSHELNNPLAVVIGQAALLRESAGEGPHAARAEKIVKAAERCGRIVRSFLALARQQPVERRPVSLNQVVQEAMELLAYPLRVDSVEVQLALAPALPDVWADPNQLHQVVVNLVSNAHHAMRAAPPPRRVTVSTRVAPEPPPRVQLEVDDTGPGIPGEIQTRIFEPFFTTKPAGQGTGLGLSLCASIVEAHTGTIRLVPQPGPGARFLIVLPVDPRRAPKEPAAAAAGPPAPPAPRRVLVVDDEPEVAEMLADVLRLEGHHVETVASGRGALEALGRRPYDLVLSDVRMPGFDGPGLYREVARLPAGASCRVVFLTGDSVSPETRAFLEDTGAPHLSKPFVPADVRRLVRAVLAGSPG
jgi:signal transduction histidine kinase